MFPNLKTKKLLKLKLPDMYDLNSNISTTIK